MASREFDMKNHLTKLTQSKTGEVLFVDLSGIALIERVEGDRTLLFSDGEPGPTFVVSVSETPEQIEEMAGNST